jgi:hypothetical protein
MRKQRQPTLHCYWASRMQYMRQPAAMQNLR